MAAQTLPNGDLMTRSGFIIPASAHRRHLEDLRRRRLEECKYALGQRLTVSYSVEQLREDGWGPRQIKRLTGGRQ